MGVSLTGIFPPTTPTFINEKGVSKGCESLSKHLDFCRTSTHNKNAITGQLNKKNGHFHEEINSFRGAWRLLYVL